MLALQEVSKYRGGRLASLGILMSSWQQKWWRTASMYGAWNYHDHLMMLKGRKWRWKDASGLTVRIDG